MLKSLFCLRSSSHPPLLQFDQTQKRAIQIKPVGDVLSWLKIAAPVYRREHFKNVTWCSFFITEIFLLYSIIIDIIRNV